MIILTVVVVIANQEATKETGNGPRRNEKEVKGKKRRNLQDVVIMKMKIIGVTNEVEDVLVPDLGLVAGVEVEVEAVLLTATVIVEVIEEMIDPMILEVKTAMMMIDDVITIVMMTENCLLEAATHTRVEITTRMTGVEAIEIQQWKIPGIGKMPIRKNCEKTYTE
jgi:hypothetical protein